MTGPRASRLVRPALLTLIFAATIAACGNTVDRLDAQSRPLPGRGEPTASVVILLFSDFQNPACAQVEPVLREVRTRFPKDVQVVFKHAPAASAPQSPLAHEAAIEAGRQGKFWEMHDLLFANQQKLTRDDLVAHARQLGLDVAAFTRALDDHTHRSLVERDSIEARALGVTTTPTMFINGHRLPGLPSAQALITGIDGLIKRSTDSVPTSTFDLTGSPVRGAATAPVTIVSFSDFQCGYCARVNATVAKVLSAYDGRVKLVYKHYPLDIHAEAPLAHRASLAANEQGKFWEMHDAIFANQRAMTRADLLKFAGFLGLDIPRFTEALDSARFKPVLDRDQAEGSKVGVDGTPTFFINGQRLVGSQPYEAFTAAIDKALAAGPASK